jgi:hypothetical protein
MSRRKPPHIYLTDTERLQLSALVGRGARYMPAEHGNRLIRLAEHALADLKQARATAAGLTAERDRARRDLEEANRIAARAVGDLSKAERELAMWRQRSARTTLEPLDSPS